MQYYNRQKAIEYAKYWWNKRNPNYYNFDKIGGDCTNFISQCLLAGGFYMNTSPNSWFYYSSSNRAPSWTGVNELFDFITKNKTNYGPKAKLVAIEDVQVGDIIQLLQSGNDFHHTLIITQILGEPSLNNILVTCHTRDAYNKRLSDYMFKKIRFLKLLS